MKDDPKMIELLVDMLYEAKETRQEIFELRQEMRQEQVATQQQMTGLRMEQQRTTQAILSLTSLMQKALIEPAEKQSKEIADIKERLDRLERAH